MCVCFSLFSFQLHRDVWRRRSHEELLEVQRSKAAAVEDLQRDKARLREKWQEAMEERPLVYILYIIYYYILYIYYYYYCYYYYYHYYIYYYIYICLYHLHIRLISDV